MFHVKQNNREKGLFAEKIVIYTLKNKGFDILEHNYFCKNLEIDIIAKKKAEIFIIEVKSVSRETLKNSVSRETFFPEFNMTEKKFKNIYFCAMQFLRNKNIFIKKISFQLFSVEYSKKEKAAKIKIYNLASKSFT